jgi:hypothetical protein
MVAVVLLGVTAMHAVIDGIGIGEAVDGVTAMAEGHDRGRCDEAKSGKNRDHHRRAEAKPGAECPHDGFEPSGSWSPPQASRDEDAGQKSLGDQVRSSPPREDTNNTSGKFLLLALSGRLNERLSMAASGQKADIPNRRVNVR